MKDTGKNIPFDGEIIRLHDRGYTQKEISSFFSVGSTAIGAVIRGIR